MVNLAARQKQMPHLGQGFAFPFRMSQQGRLALSTQQQSVRESIWLILLTEPGERLYRPSFGCRLSELAFAPINAETLMLMRIWVQEALVQWEPRIEVDSVLAQPQVAQGVVFITINYRLRKTNVRQNLVYPFYLQGDLDESQTLNAGTVNAYLENG
ncbi:MAG: GPW/gp25 family protein [Leptolyngbya sp. SIO1D8]|nr:GPW/gp25 family protein [Leptolyngbya sp. SIO1D8]